MFINGEGKNKPTIRTRKNMKKQKTRKIGTINDKYLFSSFVNYKAKI